MKKSELIKAISNVVVTGETKIPEDYEATVIDNTIVAVSKTIDLDEVAQNETHGEEETFVGTLLPEEESAPESEPEASEKQSKKKLLVASVRNIETNEFEVVRGEYANRNEFYAALREQGYRVRYVSSEENFERDGEKYKKACEKVKADRKAARAAKKMEAKK